jgi:hypothetical protein
MRGKLKELQGRRLSQKHAAPSCPLLSPQVTAMGVAQHLGPEEADHFLPNGAALASTFGAKPRRTVMPAATNAPRATAERAQRTQKRIDRELKIAGDYESA